MILKIEVLRDQRLDLLADCCTVRLRRTAVGALLRTRVGLESKHLAYELRADAITPIQVLHHPELDRQLTHLGPVLVAEPSARQARLRHSVYHDERLVLSADRSCLEGVERSDEARCHQHQECPGGRFGFAWTLLHDALRLHLHRLRIGHLLSVRLLRARTHCDGDGETQGERDTTGDHKTIPVRVV